MTAFVQSTNGQAATSGTTVASGSSIPTAGNLLIVYVRWGGAGDTTVTLTDTLGNTYQPLGHLNHTDNALNLAVYYAKNCLGGSANVVTATLGNARTLKGIIVDEVSGCDVSSPFSNLETGTATAAASIAAANPTAVNSAGYLATFGAWGVSETTVTGPAGYTTAAPNNYSARGYKLFTGPGASETPSFTVGTATDLLAVSLFFQAPFSGSASDVSTGTGSLSTGIPLAGSATDQATSTGNLTTGVPLTGSAADISTGSADLTTPKPLAGAASDQSAGTGQLSTGIPLGGYGADTSVAVASLSTGIPLDGDAADSAIAAAALSTGIQLQGTAQDSSEGSADLTVILFMPIDSRYLIPYPLRDYATPYTSREYAAGYDVRNYKVST